MYIHLFNKHCAEIEVKNFHELINYVRLSVPHTARPRDFLQQVLTVFWF